MELNTIWKGQLCHKTKTIAEVVAKSKKDCPVVIPQNLDVHQKVKYEEFSEKVVKKSGESLSFDSYINQDEHCLMVVVFIPTNEKSILSSFMAFLIKTQSVGVSVLGENESVIFLVPSGLVSGNMLPPVPEELGIDASANVLFGVLKISKVIFLNARLALLYNEQWMQARLHYLESQSAFNCIMHRQSTECGKTILQELPPLDVKPEIQFVGTVKMEESPSENKEVPADIYTGESPKSNEVPDSLSENPKNLTRLSVYMSNLPLLTNRVNTYIANPDKNMFASQLKAPKKKLSLKDYKRRIENRGCQSPGLPDLSTDIQSTCDKQELEKSSKNVDSCKDVDICSENIDGSKVPSIENIDSSKVPSIETIDSSKVPSIETIDSSKVPSIENIDSSIVLCNESELPVLLNEKDNAAMPETTQTPVEMPDLSQDKPLDQSQNDLNSSKIKSEKLDTEYDAYDDEQNPIKLVLRTDIKKEVEEESNQDSDSEEEDLDGELPDLGADTDSDMDAEEQNETQNNPGDSISFKSGETVIFKPKVYSRVLEDLDKLKSLLGDTAKINSTLHREKCMQLVDTIGDKLIGNRIRKKCTVRSIGNVTDLTKNKEVKPKIFINSEVQTDSILENIYTGELSGSEPQSTEEKVSTSTEEKVSTTTDNINIDNKEVRESKICQYNDITSKVEIKNTERLKSDACTEGKTKESPVIVESEVSDDEVIQDDSEGYFTMLLKLNGALDDLPKRKSQGKTIKRTVTTSSYRVATKSSFNAPAVIEPVVQDPSANIDYDRTGRCTPETGAQPCEGNNVVQYVDGRLCFQPNYNTHSNERSDQPLPQYDRAWSSSGYESEFTSCNHSESGYSHNSYASKPISDRDNTIQNDFNPHIMNMKSDNNIEKTNHLPLSNPPFDSGNYSSGNSVIQPYRDVDLRNDNNVYSNAVYPVGSYHNVPPTESVIESSSYTNDNNVYPPPSITGTVDTTYYTEVVHDVHDEIDKEMETEMIDILEILHEGTAAEQASLKKPKGRSKRARKKRRAIAEAEKLFSLVSLAEKIESQHKLSVLSEKQKKREFYKKIIQTYAAKGPENRSPKDEETMIMECVEQLMEDADKEIPSSSKSVSDKRKSSDEIDFSFDNYEGLSEKKKKKYSDEDDCKIVEQLRYERRESDRSSGKRYWGRERGRSPNFQPGRNRKYNGRRSCSSEKATWSRSSPEKHKHKELPKGKRPGPYHSKSSHADMSPDQKHQMFEMWPDARYINHLFITASKITYGADNGRPWLLKVKSCVNSIIDRRISIKRRLECMQKDLNAKDVSFSKRDKLYQEEKDNMKNLKNIDFLSSLYNYYQCKFIIVDTLQEISKEKPNNPSHFSAVLINLRDKLKVEKENLRHSAKDATTESDKKLIRKAQEECQEMIDNIKATKKRIHRTASK